MSKLITIDTNLLLDDPNIIYKLSIEYDSILIPLTVLKELDKHKYNPNLSYSARNAISSIREFKTNFPNKIIFNVDDDEINNNDSFIINSSKKYGADLATKDISMSIVAESKGLKSRLYDVVLNNIYNPYNYVTVEEIYKYKDIFTLDRFYGKDKYKEILDFFSTVLNKDLDPNLWFFIFIQNETKNIVVYANHPLKQFLIRIDHHPQYNEIKCENGIKVIARDIYQNCAIYAFREAPNILLTGKWGSGKSLLSSAFSVENRDKKAFISRSPVGINSKYEIGFLPGSKTDKMMDWLGGFTSSLYFIYGNTNGQRNNNSSYNYVKDELFDKKFEILPLNSIQGLSLLEDDLMIIDEIQLVSVDYMSMILSRPSENGKLILLGDLKQTYNIVKPSESGLLKLLRILPHHSMAFVNLETSYRADIIELADKLQDKTIG